MIQFRLPSTVPSCNQHPPQVAVEKGLVKPVRNLSSCYYSVAVLPVPDISKQCLLLMHLSVCLMDISFPSDGRTGMALGLQHSF